MDKIKYSQEWIKQAEYDLETAKIMLKNRRYIYCVFMSHLSIEKALKSLYVKKYAKNPPKIHSLVYFVEKIHLDLPSQTKEFLEGLDEISVPTRYPEALEKLLREYNKAKTEVIFNKSKEVFKWLKKKLEK